jgi:dTDP-4-dehydrorhamnose reductase
LLAALPARGVETSGVDVEELDITARDAVGAYIGRLAPTVVINAAAFTRVDECESRPAECYAVNAGGAENVARAAKAAGARVIQLSTDYVFDGATDRPYVEGDAPSPLNVYGASKLEGERRVAAVSPDAVIVRTAWLFGAGGPNFIAKIMTRARAGEALRVVNDQRGSPTFAGHLAAALAELVAADFRGVVHVAGVGVASWYDVAAEALRAAGLPASLAAITTAELGAAARRPLYSALDCSLYARLTGKTLPPWETGVAAYVAALGEGGVVAD